MPLIEQKRKQLDSIIQQMIQNKETDSNIQFVVNDFVKKYSAEVEQPKQDLLQKTGSVVNKIFPGKQIGEAIGTGIAKFRATPEEKKFISPAPTPTQIAGDVANIGLNIAGLKGAGIVGNLGQRIIKMIGLGAGLSATQSLKEGGGAKDVVKSATIGGVVGGAIPLAGAGLRTIGRQIETFPARFVNSALSRSKQEVLQDIAKDKVDDFAKYVMKSKPIGTANKLLNESMSNINTLSNKINTSLNSAIRKGGQKITVGTNNLLDGITKLPEAEGALLNREGVKSIIEKLAPQTKKMLSQPSLTITESNKLRQLVDKTLGDRAFLGGQLSSDKIILKKFADTLRETVKSKAPEGTRELFAELSNEIRFRDGLLDRIARKAGNQVLSFGDFIGGGLGGIFGGGWGGAVAGVATRRAIESVPFKLSVAKITNAATKLEPIINQLNPAQQTAILDFFSEIFSQNSREKDQVKELKVLK